MANLGYFASLTLPNDSGTRVQAFFTDISSLNFHRRQLSIRIEYSFLYSANYDIYHKIVDYKHINVFINITVFQGQQNFMSRVVCNMAHYFVENNWVGTDWMS